MRKFALSIVPAALVVAPLALAAPPAATSRAPMQPPVAGTAMQVDTATLHKFASAYEDLRQVRMKYMPKLQAAKTTKEKAAIKQQATSEMEQDIGKHMPVAEYVKVRKAVQANPALRKKLISIIRSDTRKRAPSALTHGD